MFLVRGQTDRSPQVPVKVTTARAEREIGASVLEQFHTATFVIIDTGATHTTIPFCWLADSVSHDYVGRFFIGYGIVNEIRLGLNVAEAMAQCENRRRNKQITDADYKKAQQEFGHQGREIIDRCREIDEIATLRTGGGRIGAVKVRQVKLSICIKDGPPETITAPALITAKGDLISLGMSTVGQLYMCWLKGGLFYLSREQYHPPLELCQCRFVVAGGESLGLGTFKTEFRMRPHSYFKLEPTAGGLKCSAIVEESTKDRYKKRVERFCGDLNLNLLEWEESPLTKHLGAT